MEHSQVTNHVTYARKQGASQDNIKAAIVGSPARAA
jgi:hypothetical protein